MNPSMPNSSSHISYKDGTSSAAAQPVIETTAPSHSLASMMANWSIRLPATPHPEATVRRTEHDDKPQDKAI
jgi:hypothetical protein